MIVRAGVDCEDVEDQQIAGAQFFGEPAAAEADGFKLIALAIGTLRAVKDPAQKAREANWPVAPTMGQTACGLVERKQRFIDQSAWSGAGELHARIPTRARRG